MRRHGGGGMAGSGDPFADDADLPATPRRRTKIRSPNSIWAGRPAAAPTRRTRSTRRTAAPVPSIPFDQPAGGGRRSDLIPDHFDILGDDTSDSGFDDDAQKADHVPSEGEFFQPAGRHYESLGPGAIPDDWDSRDLDGRPAAGDDRAGRRQGAARNRGPGAAGRGSGRWLPVAERPAPRPVAQPASAGLHRGDGGRRWPHPFLGGAGLDPAALAGADPEATMRIVGEAFREMVKGLQEPWRHDPRSRASSAWSGP